MGAQTSKTTADVINESVVNAIVQSAQNCTQDVSTTQSIVSSGISIFANYKQNIKFTAKCLQTVNVDDNLITSITAAIQDAVQQNNIALLPSYSGTTSTSSIKNVVKTNISQSFIQNCASKLTASQIATYGGIQIGVASSQDVNMVTQCLSDAVASTNLAATLAGDTSSTVTQTTKNPLDFITNIFSGFGLMIFGFIFLIIILFAL